MKLELELTEDEVEILERVVSNFDDCGPPSEGWRSPEMELVGDKVRAAIEMAMGR